MGPRQAGLTAAALAALALAAPAASARIVPQEGMAGLRISMSVAQVRDARGAPDAVIFGNHPIIGRNRVYKYGTVYAGFDGAGRDARVISLWTRGRAERTARGIGVGSRRADVDRREPRTVCKVEFGLDHCYRGTFLAGKIVTDYRIGRSGRVTSVTVGRVVD